MAIGTAVPLVYNPAKFISAMALASGARIGPYEILSAIGAGGMGEVYRARDPRLGREVAIKVLPSGFSVDPVRLHRFEQEARAAAALNHPNILAVHDIGTHDGSPYIVSELLEGETLRARLESATGTPTPLPPRKAIDYGIQIAHGLAAAHDKGIVHRDLKPENLFVTLDGRVKILDFGLAKLIEISPALAGTGPSEVQTKPGHTDAGVMLGTMGYMSPEQVRGQTADHRADIFAFGAVLYEALSGARAFAGATPADTMSAILHTDPPDLPTAGSPIPAGLARIVDRCLEKSATARFQSAHDLAFALEALSSQSSSADAVMPAATSRARLGRRERVAWTMAGLAAVTAIALAVMLFRGAPVNDAPLMRVDLAVPATSDPASMAISPDGRRIVFSATSNGKTQLWLRSLDSTTAQPLAGTENATLPFWSPDSRTIGFLDASGLKRADIAGGTPQALIPIARGGGSWNRDGVIIIKSGQNIGDGIGRLSATGHDAVAVTHPDARHTSHSSASFLPDGRHFLYFASAGTEPGVYVSALDSSEDRRLLQADTLAVYAPPGYLLFVRNGALFAQRFDAKALQVVGDPVQLAQQVATGAGLPAVSVSATGLVAYRGEASPQRRQLVWFDRSGKQVDTVGAPDDASPNGPQLSPDGKQIALTRTVDGNADIWLIETARGVATRFTFDPGTDVTPVWSPDGTRVAFGSLHGKSVFSVYQKLASGAGTEELLFDQFPTLVTDWSSDGRFLLLRPAYPKTGRDLWAVPTEGARRPFPIVNTQFEERDGQFSPDGRWVAYASNASGRFEVYVQPFPTPSGKWQISTMGGNQPRWRRDGKELFYIAPDGMLTAVPIAVAPDGRTMEAGRPTALFTPHIVLVNPAAGGHLYAVAPDGQRFLVDVSTGETNNAPITVMTNWTAALNK